MIAQDFIPSAIEVVEHISALTGLQGEFRVLLHQR